MKLTDVINEKWLDANNLSSAYAIAKPFPHIVMEDFINPEVLEKVLVEFPIYLNKMD